MVLRRTVIQWGMWAVLSPWQAWLDRQRAALLVGINTYGDALPPLQGCLLDISLQDHVLQRWGWAQRQLLSNQQATQAAFADALKTLAAHDLNWFHFSGYVDAQGLWLVDGICPWAALADIRMVFVDGRPLPEADRGQPLVLPLSGSSRTLLVVGYGDEQHQRGSLTSALSVALWHGQLPDRFPHSQHMGSLALPKLPLASGFLTSPQHVWLGGIPRTALTALLPGTTFRRGHPDRPEDPELVLVERQGWQAKVQGLVSSGDPLEVVGSPSLVLETARVLPSKLPLKVGLGSRLERVERVDVTNALAGQGWLEIGAAEWDCTLDHREGKGFGLLNRYGDPWWGTFGGEEESLAQALQRLLPRLRGVQAWKKLGTLLNPAHPLLSLQITSSRDTLILEANLPPDWILIGLNWDPQGSLTLLTPRLLPKSRLELPLPPEPGIHEFFAVAAPPHPDWVAAYTKQVGSLSSTGWIPLNQPWEWLQTMQDCLSEPDREPETRRWHWHTVGVQSGLYTVKSGHPPRND